MAQPEFVMPDFLQGSSTEEIHERMMSNLPPDIDDMPGGFPYDFTRPAAIEKDELINFHLVRSVMIAFPQYAWDEWLDLHGKQVNLPRHEPQRASGHIVVNGTAGTLILAGTVFCTAATDTGPSIEFSTDEDATIGEDESVEIPITAVEPGPTSNVRADTINLMLKPDKAVTAVTNPEKITGGTERENDDDYFDRIAVEYDNSLTYLGNDTDYIRWSKEAGAGDCIVVPAANGPGTVKLVLVDANGQPANEKIVEDVYNYIVSPGNRKARLLPTACSELSCVPATTVRVNFTITGLQLDAALTDIEKVKVDFSLKALSVYSKAKDNGVLRYNDIRPIISKLDGVLDFDTFLMDGAMENIQLTSEQYPETGTLDFS